MNRKFCDLNKIRSNGHNGDKLFITSLREGVKEIIYDWDTGFLWIPTPEGKKSSHYIRDEIFFSLVGAHFCTPADGIINLLHNGFEVVVQNFKGNLPKFLGEMKKFVSKLQ